MPTRRSALALTTVCVPMFLVLLDVLVVNIAMPVVGRELQVSPHAWAGLVDAYTVPLALALLPSGWLTDRLGARRTLLAGLIGFALASAWCATAESWTSLLGGRTAQGLGAALMLPASLAALSGLWREPAPRARALGVWSGVSALATAFGPAFGGLALTVASWRAIFWLNVPLCLAATVGTAVLLPHRFPTAATTRRTLPRQLAGSTITGGLMTVVGNGTLTAATLQLQERAGQAPLPAAVTLLIATVPFAALGPFAGRIMARRGRRWTALAGLTIGAAGLVVAASSAGTPTLLLAVGVALGLMTAPIVGEALASQPGREGLASGINNTARQLGTSAGVAGATALMASPAHSLGTVALLGALIWLIAAAVVRTTFSSPALPRAAGHGSRAAGQCRRRP